MELCLCTIVSKNYISFARTVVNSFLDLHPSNKAYVLLADKNEGYIDEQRENFELISLEDLQIPRAESFCFRYDSAELCNALKPYLLTYLLQEKKHEKALFLDSDTLILQRLDEVDQLLDDHSIMLTPHITSPLKHDGKQPSELDLIKAGTFNAGFIAIKNDEKATQFLKWWKDRLYYHCINAQHEGLFMDQKWLELVPALFSGTYVLRSKKYNAAYWNLHERTLSLNNNQYYVNDVPLAIYHFSGFSFDLSCISAHQNRFTWDEQPVLYQLFKRYRKLLIDHDYETTIQWPNALRRFDNGTKVTGALRQIYSLLEQKGSTHDHPYATTSPHDFLNLLVSTIPNTKFPWLFYEFYKDHPEVIKAFQQIDQVDQKELVKKAKIMFLTDYKFYINDVNDLIK